MGSPVSEVEDGADQSREEGDGVGDRPAQVVDPDALLPGGVGGADPERAREPGSGEEGRGEAHRRSRSGELHRLHPQGFGSQALDLERDRLVDHAFTVGNEIQDHGSLQVARGPVSQADLDPGHRLVRIDALHPSLLQHRDPVDGNLGRGADLAVHELERAMALRRAERPLVQPPTDRVPDPIRRGSARAAEDVFERVSQREGSVEAGEIQVVGRLLRPELGDEVPGRGDLRLGDDPRAVRQLARRLRGADEDETGIVLLVAERSEHRVEGLDVGHHRLAAGEDEDGPDGVVLLHLVAEERSHADLVARLAEDLIPAERVDRVDAGNQLAEVSEQPFSVVRGLVDRDAALDREAPASRRIDERLETPVVVGDGPEEPFVLPAQRSGRRERGEDRDLEPQGEDPARTA